VPSDAASSSFRSGQRFGRLLLVLNDPIDLHANRLALVSGARAAGWDVHVAGPDEPAAERIRADGWPYHAVAIDRLGMSPRRELAAVGSLAALYRRLRPSVVHLRAVKPILAGGLAAAIGPQAGLISHFCGLGQLFTDQSAATRVRRAVLWPLLRRSLTLPRQRVVVQNASDGERLLRAGLVDPRRLRLIPGSGVDCRRFRPGGNPSGPVTVVLPARLLHAKGLVEFAAAGRRLRAQGQDVRLVVFGPAVERNPDAIPAAVVRAWEAEGWLRWAGPTEDMAAVYATAHIVCLPSWREGLPKALLEAAACGLPVITTDVPGCRDAVDDGSTGLLVPVRDPLALAGAIATLAGDPGLRARFGAAGRLRAEQRFAEPRIVEAFLTLYRELEA
jgi:glycosyltransferase involved in cell wall biosynthesis